MIFQNNVCGRKYFAAQNNTSITCFIILSKPPPPALPPKRQCTNGYPSKKICDVIRYKRELPEARLAGWLPSEMLHPDTQPSITAKTNLPNITQWQVHLFCQLRREGETVGRLNEKAGAPFSSGLSALRSRPGWGCWPGFS